MSQDNETFRTRKITREEWDGFAALARLGRPGGGLSRCVQSAYLTMNRTLVGMAKSPNADDWRRSMTDCLEERLTALTCRPTWNQDEFDTWHRDTTSGLVQEAENPDFEFTVGQAQKWINVSIKNAVALGERLTPNFSCVYDVAHVALDRIVLGELRRKDWMPRELLQGPWSQLTDYEEYMTCQRLIRENLPGIPLEEEFRLWQEGRATAEARRASGPGAQVSAGKQVSLEYRFQHLAGYREEVETERREQSVREAKDRDEFIGRFASTTRRVCQAFANSIGWKCEDPGAETGRVPSGSFTVSFDRPVEGCKQHAIGYFSLTLSRSADDDPLTPHHGQGTSEGEWRGEIRVGTRFDMPHLLTHEKWHWESALNYRDSGYPVPLAADIDLTEFETMVADVLEGAFKSLMQWCIFMDVDI